MPVPGGVPLRWLGYAAAVLLAVLTIGSVAVAILLAGAAGMAGFALGGRDAALAAAGAAFVGAWVAGLGLSLLDWPLRLVVLPVAAATLATQATPDGRKADRFALSWLALRLAPARRSLGRALPRRGAASVSEGRLWVAADERSPALRRARVSGAGTACFAAEVLVRRVGRQGQRLRVRPARGSARRGERRAGRVAIGGGEVMEIRP